jgi:ABC-type Fe3+-siderophore transport system permease subunit
MKLNEIDDKIGAGIKRWWHSLTIWVGKSLAVAGTVLQELSKNTDDIRNALGTYGGAVVAGIGISIVLLRLRTKSAVQVRKPKP